MAKRMKLPGLAIERLFVANHCQISGTIMAQSTVTRWYSVCALNFKDANTHIIISTGAECDMGGNNNSNTTANGNICFYGQDTGTGYIHFGYRQLYVYGDVFIYGGSILTYSDNYKAGKILTNGKLTLGWTNGDDYIKSMFQYSETYKYNYVDGKYFTDGSTLNPQIYNNSQTYYLSPCITLANNADIDEVIESDEGYTGGIR